MSSGPEIVYEVPPMSWHQIDEVAWSLRSALGCADVRRFPVEWVLETALEAYLPDYAFDVGDIQLMGGAEGQTAPDGSFIRLREDVYIKMLDGDGRARFTASHELGHFLLHRNATLQRAAAHKILPYKNSEMQANHFAASVLMPTQLIKRGMSARDMVDEFGVSAAAAQHRFENLGMKGISTKGRTSKPGGPPSLF